MSSLDELYESMEKAREDRKRRNFDAFFTSLYEDLEKDLDQAYKEYGNTEKYLTVLNRIKTKGFKVMRNNNGKHKVEVRA